MIKWLSGLHHQWSFDLSATTCCGVQLFPSRYGCQSGSGIFIRILTYKHLMTLLKPILSCKIQLNSMDLLSVL